MEKADLEKLIADKPPDIKAKAVLLWNGMSQGVNAYQKESTSARLKDWQAAEAALEEFVASIIGPPVTERTFSSIVAVVDYLHANGWKISTRTGYNHFHKKLLLPRNDGKYYQSDVEKYASSGILPRLDGNQPDAPNKDLERKSKADADAAEYDARIKRIKAEAAEGRYIEKSVFERDLASRAAIFRNDLENFFRSHAGDIIHLVDGDEARTPELIEYLLAQGELWMNRYAEDREWTVPERAMEDLDDEADDKEDK